MLELIEQSIDFQPNMLMRLASRQDLPDMATVNAVAMMNDEVSLYLSPEQAKYPEVHRERCLRSVINRWNEGQIMLVMSTEECDDGWNGAPRIVAYAAYEKEIGALDDSSKSCKTILGGGILYAVTSEYPLTIVKLLNDSCTA